MMFNAEHDRYVAKNRMLASGYDSDRRARKSEPAAEAASGRRQNEPSCFNCRQKRKCSEFNAKRGGGATGAVSFGGGNDLLICARYVQAPVQEKSISDKQIKSLMKNFKKGY